MLAAVLGLDVAAARASHAELLLALVQRCDLGSVALGQGGGRVVDHGSQLGHDLGNRGPLPVELVRDRPPGLAAGCHPLVGGQHPGPVEVACGCGGHQLGSFAGGQALGDQYRRDLVVGNRAEVDLGAARRDGDVLGQDLLGQQHPHDGRGRLLHRLEQGRGRGRGGGVEPVHHQHLAGALHRCPAGLDYELGHLLLAAQAVARGAQDEHVGMLFAGSQPPMARCPGGIGARPAVGGHDQLARERSRRRPLARTRRSHQQVGVHRGRHRGRQSGNCPRLAHHRQPRIDGVHRLGDRRCRVRFGNRRLSNQFVDDRHLRN